MALVQYHPDLTEALPKLACAPREQLDPDDDGVVDTDTTTYHLVDTRTHTGHTQSFETHTGDPASPTRTYIYGHDALSQDDFGTVVHLLADGHGSTRMLVAPDGGVVLSGGAHQVFHYDAYGTLPAGEGATLDQAATKLLYSGEAGEPERSVTSDER